jgi:hypothetical protein
MPEEVVILCKLLRKHNETEFIDDIYHRIQHDYVLRYIREEAIDFKEVCKVY